MAKYPSWNPPDELFPSGVINPQANWSRAQADLYLEWLVAAMAERLSGMFQALAVARSSSATKELAEAGAVAFAKFSQDDFVDGSGDRPRLNAQGRALAADMGLLVAHWLLSDSDGQVSWRVCRESKHHADFNRPVILGEQGIFFDPVGGSIANAHGCVRGTRDSRVWLDTFNHWLHRLNQEC